MDCVKNGSEQLHTEVFRAGTLDQVAAQAKSFFSMMPNLEVHSGAAGDDQEPETDEDAP